MRIKRFIARNQLPGRECSPKQEPSPICNQATPSPQPLTTEHRAVYTAANIPQQYRDQCRNTWTLQPYTHNTCTVVFCCCARTQSYSTLRPHGLQHTRLPCPSPSPRVYSNSRPLNQWCHPTISSSVTPFFSCLQSSPASGSFLMSWLFASRGQSIGASVSASVLPTNIQD